jgi:hypothetical protein
MSSNHKVLGIGETLESVFSNSLEKGKKNYTQFIVLFTKTHYYSYHSQMEQRNYSISFIG